MGAQFKPRQHNRRSIRLKGYDYTQPGVYFITICSYRRAPIFGDICSGEMPLNRMGLIAQKEWSRLEKRFPFLGCGSFVVMPNHVHGVLMIMGSKDGSELGTAEHVENRVKKAPRRAPTADAFGREKFGSPVCGSIPTIVRSYKASVTWRINHFIESLGHSVWERNYYEHVIRNDADRERIEAYVASNPMLWDIDQINPDHR